MPRTVGVCEVVPVFQHGLDMEELPPATENPFPTTGLSLECT